MPYVIPWPDPPIIAAIITTLGVAFGAWLTWLMSGARELRERIAALETRMERVESENGELRSEKNDLLLLISAMASFINRIGLWIESGMDRRRKPKPPPQVEPHIDVEPWMPPPEEVTG